MNFIARNVSELRRALFLPACAAAPASNSYRPSCQALQDHAILALIFKGTFQFVTKCLFVYLLAYISMYT